MTLVGPRKRTTFVATEHLLLVHVVAGTLNENMRQSNHYYYYNYSNVGYSAHAREHDRLGHEQLLYFECEKPAICPGDEQRRQTERNGCARFTSQAARNHVADTYIHTGIILFSDRPDGTAFAHADGARDWRRWSSHTLHTLHTMLP